jgi:hypothetical protein
MSAPYYGPYRVAEILGYRGALTFRLEVPPDKQGRQISDVFPAKHLREALDPPSRTARPRPPGTRPPPWRARRPRPPRLPGGGGRGPRLGLGDRQVPNRPTDTRWVDEKGSATKREGPAGPAKGRQALQPTVDRPQTRRRAIGRRRKAEPQPYATPSCYGVIAKEDEDRQV